MLVAEKPRAESASRPGCSAGTPWGTCWYGFRWMAAAISCHCFRGRGDCTDSDWAGDRDTRKLTSGGAITWGCHTLKTRSTSQQAIALSSGEADLYVLVNGVAQSHGFAVVLNDFGIGVDCAVCTDGSAAIVMVHQQGSGNTRHIEV